MPRRPTPPPGEGPPQMPPKPTETLTPATVPERRKEKKVDETELLTELENQRTPALNTLESWLTRACAGEKIKLWQWSEDYDDAIRPFLRFNALFLLGLPESGKRAEQIYAELLPYYDELKRAEGYGGPLFPYDREKAEQMHTALPPEVFSPVIELSIEQWRQIQKESQGIQGRINGMALAAVRSRIHELAIHDAIPRSVAEYYEVDRVIMEFNYPVGFTPSLREFMKEEEWRQKAPQLEKLYELDTLPRSRQDKEDYEQSKKEYAAMKARFGLPEDYGYLLPSGRKDEHIFRYLELTSELIADREQREADRVKLKTDREWKAKFYDVEMLPVAQRTARFFESMLRYMVEKIFKDETFWGDAEVKPFKKE